MENRSVRLEKCRTQEESNCYEYGLYAFKRQIFIGEPGKQRKPLDEMLAPQPKAHFSQSITEKAGYLISELPSPKTSPVLS